MTRFLVGRAIGALPVVFLSTVVVFLLLRLLPGDPALALAGPNSTDEVVDALRAKFGLDRPLFVQYGLWLSHIVRGDLGESVLSRLPVADLIAQRLPATLLLTFAAIVLTLVIALPAGILAAVRRGGPADWLVGALSGLALSIPSFWMAILTIMLFALILGWLPAGGYADFTRDPGLALRSLVLPAFTLALPASAALTRLVRAAMLEVLQEDYVRTGHAKGLRRRTVVLRHALRNALLPVLTLLGLQLGRLLGGAVITETIFGWPGVGRLVVDAIGSRDYPTVQAALLVFVILFVVINVLTDVSYGIADPRVRVLGRSSRS